MEASNQIYTQTQEKQRCSTKLYSCTAWLRANAKFRMLTLKIMTRKCVIGLYDILRWLVYFQETFYKDCYRQHHHQVLARGLTLKFKNKVHLTAHNP